MIVIEIIFIMLLAADTWLTYRIIESGKGVEVGWARHYIHSKPLTIAITALCFAAIVALLRFTRQGWLYVPANLYMARLVYKNWKVLNG